MRMDNRATRVTSGFILAMTTAVGAIATASSAYAAAPTASDAEAFEQFYDQYGVDETTQQRLLAVVEAGELLDAMRAGAEPVSTSERDGTEATDLISTFADGSISVTSLEKPQAAPIDGSVAPRTVSGCTIYNGGGFASYSNCLISNGNGTTSLEFTADYSRSAGGASISNWRDARTTVHYGSATAPTLTAVRTASNGQEPAVVTMYSRFTSYNGLSSEDLYLSLRVNPTEAWTTTY